MNISDMFSILVVVTFGPFFLQSPQVSIGADYAADKLAKTEFGVGSIVDIERSEHKVISISSRKILSNVSDAYAQCKSYRDEGLSVSNITMMDGTTQSIRTAFRTAFLRGKKFRFSYRENPFGRGYSKANILLHERNRTLLKSERFAKFKKIKSLGTGVASLTGVSSSTAHFIPVLLMPKDIGGRKLIELSDLKEPQIEVVNNNNCYRVEGLISKEKTVLWITTASYLIVKIEDHTTVNGKLNMQTISYTPRMDENIPVRLFDKQVEDEWKHLKPIALSKTPRQ